MRKLFQCLSFLFGLLGLLAVSSRPRTTINPPRPRF